MVLETSWIRQVGDELRLNLQVQANASKTEFTQVFDQSLKLRVASPPVEGAANKMIIQFLAKVLDVKKSQLEIIQGMQSKVKVVAIRGECSKEEIIARLQAIL
ncbi:MAG: DUF167 domain-containing protein [Bdellovibrionota bacterium]